MFHSGHHHKMTKKEKKKAQAAKNKRDQMLFQLAELSKANVERDGGLGAPEIERPPATPGLKTADQKKQQLWSSKLQEIRSLNGERKRTATDRWNRFAGTSGGGGRGL